MSRSPFSVFYCKIYLFVLWSIRQDVITDLAAVGETIDIAGYKGITIHSGICAAAHNIVNRLLGNLS